MDYAVRAVEVFRHLKVSGDDACRICARQYLRSATSIGANLIEARSGESRRDFIHKCAIAQKEARESLYWLELMARSNLIPRVRLTPLIEETNELLSIITAIIRKAKASRPPP